MFDLTPSEKKALLVVSAIILLAAITQFLGPPVIDENYFDYSEEDSIFVRVSQDKAQLVLEGAYLKEYKELSAAPANQSGGRSKSGKKQLPPYGSIDLNSASENELCQLPRVGPATAGRIIRWRLQNGGFRKNQDLMKVKGIGPKTFEQIRPYLKE